MVAIVRPARESDVEPMVALSRRTIRASYPAILGDDAVEGYLDSGEVERYFPANLDRCIVVDEGDSVLGCAVWKENLIDLVMVDAEVHGRGIGSLLLESVEAILFDEHDELRVESFEGNAPAIRFYRKKGWRPVESPIDETPKASMVLFGKTR